MQLQIAFEACALELHLPRRETGRDGKWKTQRSTEEIVISDCSENRWSAPGSQNLEDDAGNKQGNREVNDDRMLRVSRQDCGFEIERIDRSRHQRICGHTHFSTTIVPVIFRWTEQKYS